MFKSTKEFDSAIREKLISLRDGTAYITPIKPMVTYRGLAFIESDE